MESHSLKKVNSVEDEQLPGSLENMLRGFSLQIFQMVQRVFAPNRIATRSKPSLPPSILRICSTVDVTPSPSLLTWDKLQKYAATSRRNITTMSEQWTVFKERKLISFFSLVRSNKRTGSSRRWGFFRDPRRINVALSRAREGLGCNFIHGSYREYGLGRE